MAFLIPDKTRVEYGLVIHEKIIPWGTVWPRTVYGSNGEVKYAKGSQYKADRKLSGGTGKVKYITIHNTGVIKIPDGTTMAEQYTRATWPNANMNDARVHYFIDENDCWQNLREDEVGWHAADGRGPGNETSLAIEIIMDGSQSQRDKRAEERGALLAAILLNRHGLSIDRLTTHNHWYSKKYCPAHLLPHWDAFQEMVEEYLSRIGGKKPDSSSSSGEEQAPAADIHDGDLVRIADEATYYLGKKIPGWVLAQNWYVQGEPKGCRVVVNWNETRTNAICSPIHKQYLTVVKSRSEETFQAYLVRVTADCLNIRKGPGTNYAKTGAITDHGTYTIVAESSGAGASRWGKLKSGAGWISLDYVIKR